MVFTPQDVLSMFGHFTTLCMKGLKYVFQLIRLKYIKITFGVRIRQVLKKFIFHKVENVES